MKKKQKKNLFILFVFLVAGIVAWFAYSRLLYPTESALGMFGPLRSTVSIKFPEGDNTVGVAFIDALNRKLEFCFDGRADTLKGKPELQYRLFVNAIHPDKSGAKPLTPGCAQEKYVCYLVLRWLHDEYGDQWRVTDRYDTEHVVRMVDTLSKRHPEIKARVKRDLAAAGDTPEKAKTN